MSSYMLLMLEPPEQRRTRTRAEGEAVFARMLQFAEELKSQGVLRGVESLSAHSQAARVQVRAGQPRVVDGPFAEAKEMIGGFYLIDVPTRAQAIAIAQRCPAGEWCTVEVRSLGPCYDESNG
ncbi:MAG TPA: YciI family protein [Burkholderiaceae bacterium]|nr:YciI family protein [Burkholderiaceae bacterium]